MRRMDGWMGKKCIARVCGRDGFFQVPAGLLSPWVGLYVRDGVRLTGAMICLLTGVEKLPLKC